MSAMIDVKQLMRSLTQEELLEAAEAYYSSIPDPTFQLAKPFASVDGCPALLEGFAKLLRDGRYLPGHRVLEFGAGSCWAGRLLNQLGMAVTSLDVSPSALALGQRLAREQPVVGRQPPHEFLVYDGIRIDRPDRSYDRILCFDAFHHVANPEQTLAEFARVLDEGGIASFSEPGPRHSLTAESQREMRDHRVIENDIVIEEVWEAAQAAGFTDIRFSLQTESSIQLGFADFRAFRESGFSEEVATGLKQHILAHNRNVTVFHLIRGGVSHLDSRSREGLVGDLQVQRVEPMTGSGGRSKLKAIIAVRNNSDRIWRRSGRKPGCVNIGVRRLDAAGHLVDQDYFRHYFLNDDLPPGSGVTTVLDLPMHVGADGSSFEVDLVSENVCWFSQNGSSIQPLWP